ncbi:Eco47II family restriction endonuclease [Patescibacteria group bacterium]|nr:Eco47II family restriction endonuclease [Patescibacteria group bacterium]
MQNVIGDFHQQILGNCSDWRDLGTGSILDIVNDNKKIIAEIKNKYNTTKGNHKVELYDAIMAKLKESEYSGYTGYYVEIISKGKKQYDKPFTPSDNKQKGKQRTTDKKIRIIDGLSFYTLATGNKNALSELFNVLPKVIKENTNYNLPETEIKQYGKLFEKAFSTE